MNIPFPPAFNERMKLALGPGFNDFSKAHDEDPIVSIRVNPFKGLPPDEDRVPWTMLGKYLKRRPLFTLDPKLHGGAYYVQEASSMFLESVLRQAVDLTKPLRVLDLCAAPGGKSTHLLSLLHRDSLLVSNEVIRSRTPVLSENIQKWGCANVIVTSNDPRDFQRLSGYFDLILIDAPCSGEGLFRKDPGAMSEWSSDNAAVCAARQRRIVLDVWQALKKGGVLIYCTCTYNPAENSAALDGIADTSEPIDLLSPDLQLSGGRGFQFYPHKHKGEGFFITAARKISEGETARIRSKPMLSFVAAKLAERLYGWVRDPQYADFIIQEDLILMIPKKYRADIEMMIRELHVITKGTAVASLKHEKLIPEHAFALSVEMKKENFLVVDVDLDNALKFLRKEALDLNDTRKGFALIQFEGVPLGWVNLLGNRVNNLYPSSWRIRL